MTTHRAFGVGALTAVALALPLWLLIGYVLAAIFLH